MVPPNVNKPDPTFSKLPAAAPSASTPLKLPSPNVSAVALRFTRPAPVRVCSVRSALKFTTPLAASAAKEERLAVAATVKVPPEEIFSTFVAREPVPPRESTPASTDNVPLNVFAPVSDNIPLVTLTRLPVPPASTTAPANTPLLKVSSVPTSCRLPLAAPFKVARVTAALPKLAVPSNESVAAEFKVAPEATASNPLEDTDSDVVAREPPEIRFKEPAVTVAAPLNVLTPLKVRTPAPNFSSEPAASPLARTPANVPSLRRKLVVFKETNPLDAPSKAASVTVALLRLTDPSAVKVAPVESNPPLATLRAAPEATARILLPSTPLLATDTEPEDIVRAPLKVLVPDRVNSDVPIFVRPLEPVIAPEISTSLPRVTTRSPVNSIAPESVSFPKFSPLPSVRFPSSVT